MSPIPGTANGNTVQLLDVGNPARLRVKPRVPLDVIPNLVVGRHSHPPIPFLFWARVLIWSFAASLSRDMFLGLGFQIGHPQFSGEPIQASIFSVTL